MKMSVEIEIPSEELGLAERVQLRALIDAATPEGSDLFAVSVFMGALAEGESRTAKVQIDLKTLEELLA